MNGSLIADLLGQLQGAPAGQIAQQLGTDPNTAQDAIAAALPPEGCVYRGAVVLLRPGAGGRLHATFNVPSRSVELQGSGARCGIGSGITSGAEAGAEWAEWHHKRAFVERASAPFEVLETLGLHHGKFVHADQHVRRMGEAAAHFGFAFNAHAVRQELQIAALQHRHGDWRKRLLLPADGRAQAEADNPPTNAVPVTLQLAPRPF